MRAALVIAFLALYALLAFGARAYLHARATGSSGLRGLSGTPLSPAWIGGALFPIALAIGIGAPVLELSGVPIAWPWPTWTAMLGAALALVGLIGTLWAQRAMGHSWRVGVRESERTELVTQGPFALVRNPIFTFMMLAWAGLVLAMPSTVTITSWLLLVAAIELQVRFAEEPYLRAVHGQAYALYCRRVGRFVPGLG